MKKWTNSVHTHTQVDKAHLKWCSPSFIFGEIQITTNSRKHWQHYELVRMKNNWILCAWLVRDDIIAVILENSLVIFFITLNKHLLYAQQSFSYIFTERNENVWPVIDVVPNGSACQSNQSFQLSRSLGFYIYRD